MYEYVTSYCMSLKGTRYMTYYVTYAARYGNMIDLVNFSFTIVFTVELAVCAFAYWLLPFLSDPWYLPVPHRLWQQARLGAPSC